MKTRLKSLSRQLAAERYLHLMILPVIAWLIIFHYIPIYGTQIAFKDYMFRKGMSSSTPWGRASSRSSSASPCPSCWPWR